MILSEENIDGYEICVYESTNIVKSMYSVSEEKLIVQWIIILTAIDLVIVEKMIFPY